MLVAIAVLALVATVVALNAPPQRSAAQEEAEQLAARLKLAIETAVLTGAPLRLEIDQSGYAFLRRRGGAWEQTGRQSLAGGRFSVPVEIDLGSAGRSHENERFLNAAYAAEEEDDTHHVLIDPLGTSTPFSVLIGGVNAVAVSLSSEGEIEVMK